MISNNCLSVTHTQCDLLVRVYAPVCAQNRVILTFDDNPLRVGVRFDEPVIGGYDLGGLCEPGHGFLMNTNTLTVLGSGKESRIDTAALSALMEVITEVGSDKSGPRLVVFIKVCASPITSIIFSGLMLHCRFKCFLWFFSAPIA